MPERQLLAITGQNQKRRAKAYCRQKKEQALPLALVGREPRSLDGYDVLGLRAFLALRYDELDALAFGQGLVARHGNRAEMREHVGAAVTGDETETFGFVEPFDGSSGFVGHGMYLY